MPDGTDDGPKIERNELGQLSFKMQPYQREALKAMDFDKLEVRLVANFGKQAMMADAMREEVAKVLRAAGYEVVNGDEVLLVGVPGGTGRLPVDTRELLNRMAREYILTGTSGTDDPRHGRTARMMMVDSGHRKLSEALAQAVAEVPEVKLHPSLQEEQRAMRQRLLGRKKGRW